MRRFELLLAAAALLPAAGCVKMQMCAVLPVPPADSRSPRYDLPLDSRKADDLVANLAAGLNDANRKEHVVVDANARNTYRALLERLSAKGLPTRQDLANLVKSGTLKWPLAKQVVDSRDKDSPADLESPIPMSDGRYFWIFYPGKDERMTAVMVAKVNACQNLKEAKR
jgi:hypothetical protein